jgi:hypothetical protein
MELLSVLLTKQQHRPKIDRRTSGKLKNKIEVKKDSDIPRMAAE